MQPKKYLFFLRTDDARKYIKGVKYQISNESEDYYFLGNSNTQIHKGLDGILYQVGEIHYPVNK